MRYDEWGLQRLRDEAQKRSILFSVKDGRKNLSARLRQNDRMNAERRGNNEEQEYYEEATDVQHHQFLERKALHEMEMEKLALQRQIGRERLEILELERQLAEERKGDIGELKQSPRKVNLLKIREMRENEEIDDYFRVFEFTARAQFLAKHEWLASLVPKLSEKAKSVYLEMSEVQIEDYDIVKRTILKSYQLTADHYKYKFRTSEKSASEDFSQWAKRTRRYLDQWMAAAEADDMESIMEQFTIERLMDGVGHELRSWLKERGPKTADELADLANMHVQAHRTLTLMR